MKKLTKCISRLSFITAAIVSSQLYAADFSLPFISTSGLGNLYSSWATDATDASTAAANPAGLSKIHNNQFMGSAIGLSGSSKFTGTTNTIPAISPNETGTASTKLRGFMPTMFFAVPVPMCKNIVFGMGVYAPFVLTNYSKDSIVRYAATRSQIVVVDFVPSVGIKVNDKFAVGVGLDLERSTLTLNHNFGFPFSIPDSDGQNHLAGWGYGFHAGFLVDITDATRVGFNFASHVVLHLTGDSEVFTSTGEPRTKNQRTNAPLPAVSEFSIQHNINNRLKIMGTIFYDNWSSLRKVTLKNTMLPSGTTLPIVIPFNYHNTFDYSVGVNFKSNEKLTLKSGLLILNTPSNNRDRSLPYQ